MVRRRHCQPLLAAAFVLAAPAAIAQDDAHAGGEWPDKAPEVQNLTAEEAKTFLQTVAAALENDAKAEPPKEGERPRRREAAGVLARPPYNVYGLGNNRAVSQELADTIVAELKSLKEKYPAEADLLDTEIFKVSNLTIGRKAPNIEGVDTDEVRFELKDYLGKVVVIDFWGDW